MKQTQIKSPGWFSSFEWLLAWRYLKSRKRKRILSVFASFSLVGVMVGVAALITVMSVMNGFRRDIMAKLGGAEGHITIYSGDGPFQDYDAVTKEIAAIPGVKLVFPLIRGEAFISAGEINTGVVVLGIRKEDIEKRIKQKNLRIQDGSLEQFGRIEGNDYIGVLLGSRLAVELRVFTNNFVKLGNLKGEETVLGTTPKVRDYPIVGIVSADLATFDRVTVLMPFAEAQDYFNYQDEARELKVYLENPDDIDMVLSNIMTTISRPIYTSDWRAENHTIFTALEIERTVMFSILMLIIIVAALNILSGLVMLVMSKSSDIAILRTMGASSGSVLRIFIISGAIIGFLGTLLGLGLGLLITFNIAHIQTFISDVIGIELMDETIYFLKTLPADINALQIFKILISSFSLSVFATIYPALRASRLDPVQALRYG